MAVVRFKENLSDSNRSFEYAQALGPGESLILVVPTGLKVGMNLAMILKTGPGSAVVYGSTSPRSEILAEDPGVNWIEWDAGTVTETTDEGSGICSGIKAVVSSGSWRFEIVGE